MLTHFLVPIFKISPHSIKCIQFGELWKFLFLVMATILEDSFRNGTTTNLSPVYFICVVSLIPANFNLCGNSKPCKFSLCGVCNT